MEGKNVYEIKSLNSLEVWGNFPRAHTGRLSKS